jgi:prolipoprotein diacylglyceryl transferase
VYQLASIPSPSSGGFSIGPLFVHAYGLMYVLAVLAAIVVTTWRWEAIGGHRELVQEVALWGFPAGLIGGRIYFDITSWSDVPKHWWGVFAIWDGGMGLWGGMSVGVLGGLIVLRRRHVPIAKFLDIAAPGLLCAQAIGRIGNYFNQELFGRPTSLPWGLKIAPDNRPTGYEQYSTFHPAFLYEFIWDIALAGALIWIGRRWTIRPPGLFALYVSGYCVIRIVNELLRIDPAHHILGERLNFWVACTVCLAGLVWFAWSQGKLGGRRAAPSAGDAAIAR